MNIVFLDVDGVLNSMAFNRHSQEDLSKQHIKYLSDICKDNDCKIVLSSTWRELNDRSCPSAYKKYLELKEALAAFGLDIFDHTPYIHNNRPLEIFKWLQTYSEKYPEDEINFISLDDDFGQKSYERFGMGNCLVKTNYFTFNESDGGLQPNHVRMAIDKLKSRECVFNKDEMHI